MSLNSIWNSAKSALTYFTGGTSIFSNPSKPETPQENTLEESLRKLSREWIAKQEHKHEDGSKDQRGRPKSASITHGISCYRKYGRRGEPEAIRFSDIDHGFTELALAMRNCTPSSLQTNPENDKSVAGMAGQEGDSSHQNPGSPLFPLPFDYNMQTPTTHSQHIENGDSGLYPEAFAAETDIQDQSDDDSLDNYFFNNIVRISKEND